MNLRKNYDNYDETKFLDAKNPNNILIATFLWPNKPTDTVGEKYEQILKIFIGILKYNFSIREITTIKVRLCFVLKCV